eukprot:jgi/Mesen1/4106/ME000216S03357
MAACTAAFVAVPLVAPAASLQKSSLSGCALPSLAVKQTARVSRSLKVSASGGKKTITKTPNGPSGDSRFKKDASGSPAKGKGTFQFTKKYGANVDGYSPIYDPESWSVKGDTYEGGSGGLALWALTFGGLLAVGAFLVYSTSQLS